jgi:hypothetical protein
MIGHGVFRLSAHLLRSFVVKGIIEILKIILMIFSGLAQLFLVLY